ncbi:hypothetical protein Plhal304r1_c017g0060811 [Plasmopara halstedii]
MTEAQRLLNAITSDFIARNANMLFWLLLVFVDLYRTRRGWIKLNVRYSAQNDIIMP